MKNIFIIASFFLILTSCSKTETQKPGPWVEEVSHLLDSLQKPFYHGVASGDPLTDAVIIWTRITPADSLESIEVKWEVSESEDFSNVLKTGTFTTNPEKDFTVKVDVKGLNPGQIYYYRFHGLNGTSITGRTKTAPSGMPDSLRFAVVSCSNYQWGYFNSYARMAEQPMFDAVLHLGDYIYEYGIDGYGDTTRGRFHLPKHEIITLQDYRTRYSQYRLDPDLKAVHQMHPFITIWDDHEVANDSHMEGAQNHQPDTEGDYSERMAAAVKTYYEWMPMREPADRLLYRSFTFGGLADVIMLDERLEGRDPQLDSLTHPEYMSEDRSMLGPDQRKWFKDKLSNNTGTWQLIGNQVIFSDLDLGFAFPNSPRNLDSWDGYHAEKRMIADHIIDHDIKNVIFLTGDTHCSWAFEAAIDPKNTYNRETGAGAFAIELGTASINAANYDEYTSVDTARMVEQAYADPRVNPHLKYVNLRDHGYLVLTLKPEEARADWYYIETVKRPSSKQALARTFKINAGTPRLVEVQ